MTLNWLTETRVRDIELVFEWTETNPETLARRN